MKKTLRECRLESALKVALMHFEALAVLTVPPMQKEDSEAAYGQAIYSAKMCQEALKGNLSNQGPLAEAARRRQC